MSTSLEGRASPVALLPNTDTLDRGHRTCMALLTLLMAASWYGFLACISPITCSDKGIQGHLDQALLDSTIEEHHGRRLSESTIGYHE